MAEQQGVLLKIPAGSYNIEGVVVDNKHNIGILRPLLGNKIITELGVQKHQPLATRNVCG
jgi:hypothetical protein